ncbi:hypothetical protein BC834DRAFT_538114 [Gloeopeniophorella convolvens]|nr:hypothetical protein BC834DRAFT_538114 [Gloeopeniophorella convolvens]
MAVRRGCAPGRRMVSRALAGLCFRYRRAQEIDVRALEWTLVVLDEDEELEQFVSGAPGVLRGRSNSLSMEKALAPWLEQAIKRLLQTCKRGFLADAARRQRLLACFDTAWCLPELRAEHIRALWAMWEKPVSEVQLEDVWAVACVETWEVAQSMSEDPEPLVAQWAHFSQAVLSMMWATGRLAASDDDVRPILQSQLGFSPVEKGRPANIRQVAIIARFLKVALPVIEDRTSHASQRLFSRAVSSFGDKVFKKGFKPEGEDSHAASSQQMELRDWLSQFVRLIDVADEILSPNETNALMFIIRDVSQTYSASSISSHLHYRDDNLQALSQVIPYLSDAGGWCFLKLVQAATAAIWTKGHDAGTPTWPWFVDCWELVESIGVGGDFQLAVRSSCARALLVAEWFKVKTYADALAARGESGRNPRADPYQLVSASEARVSAELKGLLTTPEDFLLTVALQLIQAIDGPHIYALRDDSVSDDFVTALTSVLSTRARSSDLASPQESGPHAPLSTPRDVVDGASEQVRADFARAVAGVRGMAAELRITRLSIFLQGYSEPVRAEVQEIPVLSDAAGRSQWKR